MKTQTVTAILTCALGISWASFSLTANADGDVAAGDTPSEQAAPGDTTMSQDACQALIKQSDDLWQTYSTWTKYRGDRTAQGFRDGIFQAVTNLKHFTQTLNKEERQDIDDFLSGRSGDVNSITRSLEAANSRAANLAAVVAKQGEPDEQEGDISDHFRIRFKISDNPRSIKMVAGGRPRFDYDSVQMKEIEKKYVPLSVDLGISQDPQNPQSAKDELSKEQLAIDAASDASIQKNIALTKYLPAGAVDPHYPNAKAFLIGQKLVPAKCYEVRKVAAAPAVNDRSDVPSRDWETYWMRWDRPQHFHMSSGRASPH